MLLEITISDGSIRTFTEFNNQYEMAYDRSRERLVLRYNPGNSNDTEWYFYDPAGDTAASVKGPRRAFYMTADGNGVRAFNIQSGWAVINGKQTDIETAFDCEITPDGYSYLATEPTEVAKGYIADRVIYRGTDCTVYTAHNAKNTACTVFVYQGKTKVLPVVLHDVENLGNGVFALWKNHGGSDAYYGREAILVNVNT